MSGGGGLRICDVEDCGKYADLEECEYPDGSIAGDFCAEHAFSAGFCIGCGGFFGGFEHFHFSEIRGHCPDCVRALKHEIGEREDVYEDDFEDY
jgi:hypothetical protein